jgi:CBS domain-containing protein
MTTARDIMSKGAECAQTSDTLVDVARKMRDLAVGALPICGDDMHLQGVITDRDIVVNCVANGGDPNNVMVEEYAAGDPITVNAEDSIEQTLQTMTEHGVRRVPVVDGDELVGIVSQADVARHLSTEQIGQLVEAISKAPAS